jgi:hypothetical protein
LWEKLLAEGDAHALERLAKHFEHVERDYPAALAYAARLAREGDDPRHAARLARLRRKLARAPEAPRRVRGSP